MRQTSAAAGSESALTCIVNDDERSVSSSEITVSIYEHEIPPFVEAEIARLYESVYTLPARFRLYGEARNASTYVAHENGRAIAVFLFVREQGEVKVLNKQIRVDAEEASRFARTIFSMFKSVTVISFWAVDVANPEFGLPYQRSYCLSDIVVTLPDTADQYLTSLGKSMRRTIRSKMRKLELDFPSFAYEVHANEAVSDQHILSIIALSNARMVVKEVISYNDHEETERLIRLAKMCGFVVVATIDGEVCAGMICYRVGATCFAQALAHDPQYDDYKLGALCCYLTICECIARGGKTWRFGGSTHRYKFEFQGVLQRFDYLSVYRSRVHFLLNGGRVLKTACIAYASQAKLWLLLAEHHDSFLSRVATWCVRTLKNIKNFRYGFLSTRK